MKKKGLIISSIVMVVVLVASLTTATYAWFNNSGSATVSNVTFSVSSSSDVKIGVAGTNTYKSGADFSDFYSDGASYQAYNDDGLRAGTFGVAQHGTWTGDNNDLGLNITLPFTTWQPAKAVFSASARTIPVVSPATAGAATLTTGGTANGFNPDAVYMIKANGNGNAIDNATIEDAAMNTDFLHIGFGAIAGKDNIRAYGVWIYVDRTDEKPTVGILAGLHVCYRINGGAWTDVDLYGSTHQATAVSSNSVVAPSKPVLSWGGANYTYTTDVAPAKGDAALWVELAHGTYSATPEEIEYCGTEAADIVQFEMVMYLDGTDSDSITTALKNNSATIRVLFLAVNGGQSADGAGA